MTTAYGQPYAEECSNPGRYDYWTCPACYGDLNATDGYGADQDVECRHCKRKVRLWVEDQPVCHSRLLEAEDA